MMTTDNTDNLERTQRTIRPQEMIREKQAVLEEDIQQPVLQQQQQQQQAGGKICPFCGAVNEPEAMFCAQCGHPISKSSCPFCGAEVDPDADFCEACHRYIRKDICSYCGAKLKGNEAYCPECGSPRGGLVCPTCHTMNDFAFCKQCGTPLTEDAMMLMEQVREMPEYVEMKKLADDLQEMDLMIPYASEREKFQEDERSKLRERVLTLLAQDRGTPNPIIPELENKRLSKEEYDQKKQEYLEKISNLLDKLAQQPQPRPAQVRNYAMACRPQGVRLAWQCNYKHALHSSPCGCAKPQMGGKWVVLGKNSRKEIKDDI